MTNFSKPINRALFVLCVIATGSIAGAFVWAFFFLMDKGIGSSGPRFPRSSARRRMHICRGLLRGHSAFYRIRSSSASSAGYSSGTSTRKRVHAPKSLTAVMGKVKKDGRYSYEGIGKLSLAALLPLLFGGSIGPEAGTTGVIAEALHLGRR